MRIYFVKCSSCGLMFCYEDKLLDVLKDEYEKIEGNVKLTEREADAREYLAGRIAEKEAEHDKDCPVCGRGRETAGCTTTYSKRKKDSQQQSNRNRKPVKQVMPGSRGSMTTRPRR